MSGFALWRRHVWINVIELVRLPTYAVPTFVFPVLLFLFFGVPYAQSQDSARLLMGSYAAYAVLGVAFFQFGVGIAADRATAWERFQRVLPVSERTRLSARVASALPFALGAVACVVLAAAFATKAHPSGLLVVKLLLALGLGSIPFALLGITLGYATDRRTAIPIANLIYLPMALAGGLWMPPQFLPAFLAKISPYLPSRHLGEVVWAAVNETPQPFVSWAWLLGYTAVFALTAAWGYRRDEGQRYR